MRDLRGKTAIVTGAAGIRGMGRAIAGRLAEEGVSVAVLDHPDAPRGFTPEARAAGWRGLPSVVAELEAAGVPALALDCDLTDPGAVARAVDRAREGLGGVDILVNSAAITGPVDVPATDLPDAVWDRVVKVDLYGAFYIARAAARAMLDQGRGGSIVLLASWVAKTGVRGMASYTAAKAGVLGLTQTMAIELAPKGIRVNAVCPGGVPTDINYGNILRIAEERGVSLEEARQLHIASFRAGVPLGRAGEVTEIANAVAFLASEQASYVTGQSLNVDGGGLMAR
ncbi:SDR family oxidoreductase [Salipiger sp. P9]|uniref:SDR family NAD(P)-dependent oxidoreductase n=1 Tax=Salipiger pentaromativorans TaxID=2943193 RepID=UPI0021588A0B|nr:SDR family NAD(P)-dependent oxidoreductase [Salipiger pentaromativorans]MCR8549251.1 SDR family oxidoreductase [Salipiger pentaromativorans]